MSIEAVTRYYTLPEAEALQAWKDLCQSKLIDETLRYLPYSTYYRTPRTRQFLMLVNQHYGYLTQPVARMCYELGYGNSNSWSVVSTRQFYLREEELTEDHVKLSELPALELRCFTNATYYHPYLEVPKTTDFRGEDYLLANMTPVGIPYRKLLIGGPASEMEVTRVKNSCGEVQANLYKLKQLNWLIFSKDGVNLYLIGTNLQEGSTLLTKRPTAAEVELAELLGIKLAVHLQRTSAKM